MRANNPFQDFGVVPPEVATSGSGLDLLKSMLDKKLPAPPICETTDIWPVEAEEGRVVFEAMPSARFYNPMGTVHGGWLATLLDSAMGCAVHSTLKPAQAYTTIEMKTVFVKAAFEKTGRLRCEGSVIHTGKRIAGAEGKIFDSEGRLIAYGSETCLITDLSNRS